MIDQFDRLMKRKAFLDQYKKEKWFADGLGEFDEARCVPPIVPSRPYFDSAPSGKRSKSLLMSTRRVRARTMYHM